MRNENPAPRSGMAGWVGAVHPGAVTPDGFGIQMHVPRPIATECDFWICTCREDADNEDHFFGPLVSA